MSIASVLAPVFVLVALIYALAGALIVSRNLAQRRMAIKREDIALGRAAYPAQAVQIGNSYANQFELPVLFFALVALALITHKADLTFVVLEWLFVVSRLVHAAVHTTSNRLPLRGAAFAFGMAVLGLAWILFALAIVAGA